MGTRTFSVIVGVCCAVAGWGQGAVHDDPQVLWQQATLYRDAWGVPHVYADNPRALAFAFGYAQAEDHLPQMLLAYRVANGRAAEVFGEPFAASDEFSIRMGHADLAEDALRAADPVTRDLCEGFALGANAWWLEHLDQAPPWADGVRPADILALLHCYLLSFAPFDHPTAWHRAPAAATGNAWAIGPSRSQSGNPLLVINPHTNYNGAFLWYEAHVSCGDLHVAGATLFGLPVILMGHNNRLGWALTPNTTDTADIYVETPPEFERNPASLLAPQLDPELLFYLSTFADARTVYVNTPAGMNERLVRKLETPRGPVVAEEGMKFYTYKAAGYYDFGALRQFVEMGRAQNLTAFKAALSMQQVPSFHFVYADGDGNIFYLYNTTAGIKADPTPRRPPPPPEQRANPLQGIVTGRATFEGGEIYFENRRQIGPYAGTAEEAEMLLRNTGPPPWTTPLDAEDPLYSWGGTIPISQLPFVENPASGYIQACGNPPWTATAAANVAPWDWPSWLIRDRDTYRARRVRQLIEMGPRSFADCQAMLFDVVAPFALEVVPVILQAARQNPNLVAMGHPDLPVALKLLEGWNGTADPDSAAMTFFHVWWSTLRSQPFPTLDSEDELMPALHTNAPEMQQRILTAANDATKLLRNDFNSVSVPWGAVHQIHRGARTVEAAGALTGEPVLVAEDRQIQGLTWPVTYGYGFAMAVEFGEVPRAASLVPFGSSENPDSPHFDDQLTLFTQRRLKPTRFQPEDVQRSAAQAYGRNMVLRASGIVGQFRLEAAAPVVARMTSDYRPPAALPEGLVPFTVFAEAQCEPATVAGRLLLDVHVPEVLCTDEHLPTLRIFRHGSAGWHELEEQSLDRGTRMLSGISLESGAFAVLGPAQHRTTQLAARQDEEPDGGESAGAGIVARLQSTPPTSPLVVDSVEDRPLLVDPKTWAPVDVDFGANAKTARVPAAQQPGWAAPDGAQRPESKRPPHVQVEWKPGVVAPTPELHLSDVLRGKSMEFRPPTMDALFKVTARRMIEAQMRLSNQPPEALPDDMAAFTPFAEITHSNVTPKPELAILVAIPSTKCLPENLPKLAVYSFDPQNGWQKLPGQTLDPASRSLSVLDQPPRLYAVLGPADCLVR